MEKQFPYPTLEVVLPWEDFDPFAERLEKAQVNFVIAPYLRFEGLAGGTKDHVFL